MGLEQNTALQMRIKAGKINGVRAKIQWFQATFTWDL
jgi:hypothetical protein